MFKRCDVCKKRRLFIRNRRIWLEPIKQFVTSVDPMCEKCIKKLEKDQNEPKNN